MTELPTILAELRPAIEDTLDQLLPSVEVAPRHLHEAVRYATLAGGKRIRPALVVLAGDVLGVPRSASLVGGAALEMIHTYSLVHDDLPALDDDDLRRGHPTVHRRFDEATAILAGDALLTLGLTILAEKPESVPPARRAAAVAEVGRSIGSLGMIGGQVDDLAAERNWPREPGQAAELLESIHRRKTGDLLAACLRLAAIYGDADTEVAERLGALGAAIGLMFQIADDVIDVEGSDRTLGKTAGKDAASEKLTFPGLFGLEASKERLAETSARALALASSLPAGGGALPDLVRYLATRDR